MSREWAAGLALRYGLVAVVVVLVIGFALAQPAFATVSNGFAILRAVAVVTVIACAVTLSLAVGGFDLSVGTTAGLAMMLSSVTLVVFRFDGVTALLVALAGGALVGLTNGLLIVKLRVPDLLATLAMLFVVQGLQLVITGGRSVATGMRLPDNTNATGVFTAEFLWLGRGFIGPVPVPVIVTALVVVGLHVFLVWTRHGRSTYAIGANPEASRMAGIDVNRYRLAAYVGSGALAALGGAMLAAQIGRGDVGAGSPYLLDAVAAALIGLAASATRRPNAVGTALGAVFIGIMLNGLTMANMPYYAQDLVKGSVLAIALVATFAPRSDAAR